MQSIHYNIGYLKRIFSPKELKEDPQVPTVPWSLHRPFGPSHAPEEEPQVPEILPNAFLLRCMLPSLRAMMSCSSGLPDRVHKFPLSSCSSIRHSRSLSRARTLTPAPHWRSTVVVNQWSRKWAPIAYVAAPVAFGPTCHPLWLGCPLYRTFLLLFVFRKCCKLVICIVYSYGIRKIMCNVSNCSQKGDLHFA